MNKEEILKDKNYTLEDMYLMIYNLQQENKQRRY